MHNFKLPLLAAAAALGFAGVAGAATVQVTGTFTDYRQIGVTGSLTGVNTNIDTWTLYDSNRDMAFPGTQVLVANVSGSLEIEGGVVTGGTLSLVGNFQNDFFGSGGGSRGLFQGIVWQYDSVTNTMIQQPGSGAGITGTCTFQSGSTGGAGCANALLALQNESPDSVFGSWNGVPGDFTVTLLSNPLAQTTVSPPGGHPGASWTVTGTTMGDMITGQLSKGVPAISEGEPLPTFNAAYAAQFQLQVVPLPASVWLLMTGVGLLGVSRGRKLFAR